MVSHLLTEDQHNVDGVGQVACGQSVTDLVAHAVHGFVNAAHTKNTTELLFLLTQWEHSAHSLKQHTSTHAHTHTYACMHSHWSCSQGCAMLCQCCAYKEQRIYIFTNTIRLQNPLPQQPPPPTTHTLQTNTPVHTHTHTHTHCKQTHLYTHTHTANKHTCTHAQMHTHAHKHACMHKDGDIPRKNPAISGVNFSRNRKVS